MRALVREFVVAAERQRADHDRDLKLAWTVAALSRQEKLTSLRTLLSRTAAASNDRGARRQSPAEQRSTLELLAAQTGIPLRYRPVSTHA